MRVLIKIKNFVIIHDKVSCIKTVVFNNFNKNRKFLELSLEFIKSTEITSSAWISFIHAVKSFLLGTGWHFEAGRNRPVEILKKSNMAPVYKNRANIVPAQLNKRFLLKMRKLLLSCLSGALGINNKQKAFKYWIQYLAQVVRYKRIAYFEEGSIIFDSYLDPASKLVFWIVTIFLKKFYNKQHFDLTKCGVWSTRRAHSCLTNFYATGYHHLGAGSKDTSACEIFQAHPADLLNIPK